MGRHSTLGLDDTKIRTRGLRDLCKECKQLCTQFHGNDPWCQPCNAKHFQQNFNNWTSSNYDIDEFIQKAQLSAKSHRNVVEWIAYDRFEHIKYLARGGHGTVYKAMWKDGYICKWNTENDQWDRVKEDEEGHLVALKYLHNSQHITAMEFLKEIESYILMNKSPFVVPCYGITKDPETNNFMMVMRCAKNGSLRQHLDTKLDNVNVKLSWSVKITLLDKIVLCLKAIHDNNLIHRNFHSGNLLCDSTFENVVILEDEDTEIFITDVGLCQRENAKSSQSENKKIYGVLPYVAPEVLRGKECTQASDIYGFGIIMYEVCTGLPPYYNMAHDEFLASKICQGLRPKSNYKIPRPMLDIIERCWDADPLKRPETSEIKAKFFTWIMFSYYARNEHDRDEFYKQCKEADENNERLFFSLTKSLPFRQMMSDGREKKGLSNSYITHSQAVYTSRHLDYKNLPEPKNADNDNSFETETLIGIDYTKLNDTEFIQNF